MRKRLKLQRYEATLGVPEKRTVSLRADKGFMSFTSLQNNGGIDKWSKSPAFHAGVTGSNPVAVTNSKQQEQNI